MEGLEVSIININELDEVKLRFDSEFYQKKYLLLNEKIMKNGATSIKQLNIQLDCSAFYPSITGHYNFSSKGIPFIRVDEISNGFVNITDNTAFLPKEILTENKSTIAKAYPGDVIIAKGGNTLGKIGLLTDDYPMYSICRDVLLLRTSDLEDSLRYYVWSFLNSQYGFDLIIRTASQTGQPHLTLASISEILLPLYTTDFRDIFKKIFINAQINKDKSVFLYSQAEQLLLEELGLKDWQPLAENVNIKSFKESFLTTGRLDAEYYQPKYEEIINHIKEKDNKQLKSIVTIEKSIEPGSTAYKEDGIPFIRVSNLSKFGLTQPDIHLSKEDYSEVIRPKKDTILLTKDGSVGIAYKVENDLDCITSGALLHLKIKDKNVQPDYLTLVLNSLIVKMQAERDAGGSIIQHWKPSEIDNVLIPIINKDTQQKISLLVQDSFHLRQQAEHFLEVAKHAVERAIEEDEEKAIEYINLNKICR